MFSTTRIYVSLNSSIGNKEIRIVLCNINIAELHTVNDIPSVFPNNRLHNHCNLATNLLTILKQICQELWHNSTRKSEIWSCWLSDPSGIKLYEQK
jgi:hypothetical protein